MFEIVCVFVGLICVLRLCFWCYVVWLGVFVGVCCMPLMCLCVLFVNYCVTVYALCLRVVRGGGGGVCCCLSYLSLDLFVRFAFVSCCVFV